jgi:MFS family permease
VVQRWAVRALFLANGAAIAALLPRLPELKASLGLSDGGLGLVLLGLGLGGMVGSLWTRSLIPRLGTRRTGAGGAVVLAAGLPLVALAPSGPVLFAVFVAYGVADAVMDVSTNVAGVEVQRRLGRAVLNSMHATWSIGTVTGALLGTAAAKLQVPLVLHLAGVAAACAGLALAARPHVPDVAARATGAPHPPRRFSPLLALLCALGLLAALAEATPYSWSAVYLADHTGAGPGTAGLGFTAFTTAMVLARLVADRVVDRVGPVAVVRAGGLLSGLALAAALAVGGTVPGIVAFALLGLGSAAVFPAMISAAGAVSAHALQSMDLATRLGFLVAPPLVGLAADRLGLPLALGLVVVPAALGLSALAGAVRPQS